jgi:hypothetical protein
LFASSRVWGATVIRVLNKSNATALILFMAFLLAYERGKFKSYPLNAGAGPQPSVYAEQN